MRWMNVRQAYPNQWLVIEALQARTAEGQQRVLDEIAVVETCTDGSTAFQRYRQLHQQSPEREYYYVHTSREALDIRERQWLGIRRDHAAASQG